MMNIYEKKHNQILNMHISKFNHDLSIVLIQRKRISFCLSYDFVAKSAMLAIGHIVCNFAGFINTILSYFI